MRMSKKDRIRLIEILVECFPEALCLCLGRTKEVLKEYPEDKALFQIKPVRKDLVSLTFSFRGRGTTMPVSLLKLDDNPLKAAWHFINYCTCLGWFATQRANDEFRADLENGVRCWVSNNCDPTRFKLTCSDPC